jgi:hypothetical protein
MVNSRTGHFHGNESKWQILDAGKNEVEAQRKMYERDALTFGRSKSVRHIPSYSVGAFESGILSFRLAGTYYRHVDAMVVVVCGVKPPDVAAGRPEARIAHLERH